MIFQNWYWKYFKNISTIPQIILSCGFKDDDFGILLILKKKKKKKKAKKEVDYVKGLHKKSKSFVKQLYTLLENHLPYSHKL